MSISLSFFKPIVYLKIFNSENKSNPSISNKLSRFKYFSMFKHFSFKNVQSSDTSAWKGFMSRLFWSFDIGLILETYAAKVKKRVMFMP